MNLVVRVIDNYTGADPVTIAKTWSRGDVVQVLPDDHEWGRLDLVNSDWVVLRVEIPEAEAQAITADENFGGELPGARGRAFYLDLDMLAGKYAGIPTLAQAEEIRTRYRAQAASSGGSINAAKYAPENSAWVEIVDIDAGDLRAAKRRKPAIPDPMIIG